jgi:amino acid adenylation domain-containing protein
MDFYFEKLTERLKTIVNIYKDKPAYVIGNQEVTYAQMDEMANHIASGIAQQVDLNAGDPTVPVRIGIYLGRNQHYLPCMLASIKLGCSYVPIDVENPVERRDFICQDAGVSVLITQDNIQDLLATPIAKPLPLLKRGFSEVYMIYTSGTTGRPKGVSVPYKALYCYAQTVCHPENFQITDHSVILQFASISFDASVLEIYSSLFYGGTLIIAQNEERHNALQLHKLIKEKGITFTFMPPSLLAIFPDYDFPAMETLSAGGEAIPHSLTSKIAGKYPYRFVNGYGPTETCVVITTHEFKQADEWQNIGKPAPGVVCYVVNEEGKQAAPGESGELWVGGMQVTNGYWNRPELNAKAFSENPFEQEREGIDVSRLYHSGDLVTLNPDGSFNYIGRKDSQIKLRSFRIELGEICAAIERQEGVLRAFVRLEEVGTEKYIVAYVMLADGVNGFDAIKHNLSKQLPPYMIPTFWNQVKEFKLTLNGKIDQSALVNEALNPVTTNDTPVTPGEELLIQAAAGLIGLPSINVNADLMDDVGITSLHIMQLIVLMGMSGIHLTANDFYTRRTIRGIMSAEKHPNAFWFGHGEVETEKPVIIVISGYTSFDFLFGEWAQNISHKFAIFAIESYHTVLQDELTDINGLIDVYVKYVENVVKTRNVVCLTGFCAGGEQALALAARLYNDKPEKPRVVVLDGELDRDTAIQKLLKPAYFFPHLSEERNNRRADLDINLMATMPEETYNGPVTSIVSTIYTEDSAVSAGFVKSPELKKMEKAEFLTNEARWKRRYPNCEIIRSHTNHNQFLITQESKDAVVDYFLNNI